MMKWKLELITNVLKIIGIKMEHLVFLSACAQTARDIRYEIHQIVVTPLL